MSEPFSIDTALKIGTVFEVTGASLKAALTPELDELSRLYRGRVYGIGQIGSLVKIHFGRKIMFASVRALRLQTEEEIAAVAEVSSERRVLEADLLGEGTWIDAERRLDFSRGLSGSALPMQDMYLLTDEETRHVYGSLEKSREGEAGRRVPIGTYTGPRAVPCLADIDKMFGQHCAILGSTGSGKSSAVAAILRSVLEHSSNNTELRPRIVLIDPHGEYGHALADRATVFKAYDALGNVEESDQSLHLPYWLMTSDEFRSLLIGKTEFEATSQANTVYKALAHARLVAAGLIHPAEEWVGKPASGGAHPEEPRLIKPGDASKVASFDRDKPLPFSLKEFRRHIELEQSVRVKTGKWDRVTDTDWHADFASILNKLRVLETDGRIKFLMKDFVAGDPGLAAILSQLVGEQADKRDLRIIDISGLPNEVAGPLTAAIARLLFQYKLHQTAQERENDPILIVCEEAHRYVPDRGEAQYAAAQNAIRRIAREGRKYGLGVLLVSQRPSDVEATVLSQCNTWVVLRLTNSADQTHVARMLPDSLGGMISLLSTLPRQEALFVGEAAALPARIKLRTLEKDQLPRSTDIGFAAGWSKPFPSSDLIGLVAKRMSGE